MTRGRIETVHEVDVRFEPSHSLEEVKRLVAETGLWMQHFPCKLCGAASPTPEGHDPCIAALPGVDLACCGHGYTRGYVAFSNGVVLRGGFDHVEKMKAEFE